MQMHNKDILVDELVKDINPRNNIHRNCGNGIYLSTNQQEVLKSFGFSVANYTSLKSLIFDLESYLNETGEGDLEELESVVTILSEFDYYQNTNK